MPHRSLSCHSKTLSPQSLFTDSATMIKSRKLLREPNVNVPTDNGAVTSSFPFGPNRSSFGLITLGLMCFLFSLIFAAFYFLRCMNQRSSSTVPGDNDNSQNRNHRPQPAHNIVSGPSTSDRNVIRQLPITTYVEDENRPVDCVICLSEYQAGEGVKIIPICGHVFHPHCLDRWLASHETCPLCRSTRIYEEVPLPETEATDIPESSTSEECQTREEEAADQVAIVPDQNSAE